MTRLWLGVGAAYALASVALGAAGVHLLDAGWMDARATRVYDTALRYHLFHAAALLVLSGLYGRGLGERWLDLACWCLAIGTFLFCGALYVRAVIGTRLPVPVAPVGAAMLGIGWLHVLRAALRRP